MHWILNLLYIKNFYEGDILTISRYFFMNKKNLTHNTVKINLLVAAIKKRQIPPDHSICSQY